MKIHRDNHGRLLKGHIALNKKHGMDGTKIYKTWIGLKARCFNKNDKDYKQYGGRGITVCDEWTESFENFYRDMGDKPSGMTIDRIDVDGNYCKENCRWASIKQQNLNKSNNHRIIYRGETKTITEWARKLGIAVSTLQNRFIRGWDVEKSFNYPIQIHKKI